MLRDNRRFLQAGRSSDLEIAAAPPLPAPDTGAVAREKPFPPYSGGTVQDLHLFPYSPRVPPGRKNPAGLKSRAPACIGLLRFLFLLG